MPNIEEIVNYLLKKYNKKFSDIEAAHITYSAWDGYPTVLFCKWRGKEIEIFKTSVKLDWDVMPPWDRDQKLSMFPHRYALFGFIEFTDGSSLHNRNQLGHHENDGWLYEEPHHKNKKLISKEDQVARKRT